MFLGTKNPHGFYPLNPQWGNNHRCTKATFNCISALLPSDPYLGSGEPPLRSKLLFFNII